jgi:hypothetical protein
MDLDWYSAKMPDPESMNPDPQYWYLHQCTIDACLQLSYDSYNVSLAWLNGQNKTKPYPNL